MTYVSVVTLIAYGLLLAALVAMSVNDVRTRRIPNGFVALTGLLWLVWRLVLGFAGKHMGLGFWNAFLSPAPEVLGHVGLPVYGVSLSEGIVGALVLGGGMLLLSATYEVATRKESFGGGDIKLMAVVGLFLGWERGLACLFIACVLSVVCALGQSLVRRWRGTRSSAGDAGKAADAGLGGTGLGDSAAPPAVGAPSHDPFLARTLPFAPFITLGALIAFVA